ncbi:Ca2+-binding RTX toxin-like protein [Sphingomonas kaistensis]|uniref:Ca2+-binding RTX toxin-like protein n=1 Tax=Sphingomonas kaistensis TaxID=298708 RepID=A0A7X5Y6W1_9SPHN|nr:calcium-binding protein [Sphingomonas kaistensis]NJC04990.1 Ca2+-binding RTX toxin-like protein [Sphingomonas kaistensis]
MARVILTQAGEDVDVGGDLSVIGTLSGGEVITILRGTVTLDPSFNAGGDTVRLPDDAGFYTVRLVGAAAILTGLGLSVSIPVGSAGLQVSFNDVSRTLLFDSASSRVKLGDQIVTSTSAKVAPAGGFPTLTGTEGPDVISGTEGADVIDGLGGADRINGGPGNDVLRGGAGGDDLDGSFGSDQLYGGPGDDRIYDDEGASAYLDGGTGNDWLSVMNVAGTRFDLIGGDGDDLIEAVVGLVGNAVIDGGAGADRLVLLSLGMPIAATLGSGRDQLVLGEYALDEGQFGVVTVADFQPGAFGDTVEFLRALSTTTLNWDQSGNPFASGHLWLIDREGSAVLQLDRDGTASAHGFRDVIIFSGVSAASFTRENMEGFDPRPAAQQGHASDIAIEAPHPSMIALEIQAFA